MKKPKRKLSGWALYCAVDKACLQAHGKPINALRGRYDVKAYKRAAKALTEYFQQEDAC